MATHGYPRLLTRVEAAAYLGVRPQTLAAWASLGRYGLAVIKVGRCARYRREDLDEWLRKRTLHADRTHQPEGGD